MEARTDWRDDHSDSALQVAAREGHVDILKMLIQYGADVNRTFALHEAAFCRTLTLRKCCFRTVLT